MGWRCWSEGVEVLVSGVEVLVRGGGGAGQGEGMSTLPGQTTSPHPKARPLPPRAGPHPPPPRTRPTPPRTRPSPPCDHVTYPMMHLVSPPPSPKKMCRMTDACENITCVRYKRYLLKQIFQCCYQGQISLST